MPSSTVIQFHASPKAIFLAGTPPPPPTFSEDDMMAACREAYHKGAEDTRQLLESQMLEMRTEMVRLQGETFAALAEQHAALASQFFALLPQWTMAAMQRVLAATPIDAEVVRRVVAEMLDGIEPSRERVEVRLCGDDLTALGNVQEDFRAQHPAIEFTVDPSLRPGDCQVRTRFGNMDGRLQTKVAALEEVLRG